MTPQTQTQKFLIPTQQIEKNFFLQN
jgi:hypothetical protein